MRLLACNTLAAITQQLWLACVVCTVCHVNTFEAPLRLLPLNGMVFQPSMNCALTNVIVWGCHCCWCPCADNMQQHAHAAQLQQQLAAAQAQLMASEARADGLQQQLAAAQAELAVVRAQLETSAAQGLKQCLGSGLAETSALHPYVRTSGQQCCLTAECKEFDCRNMSCAGRLVQLPASHMATACTGLHAGCAASSMRPVIVYRNSQACWACSGTATGCIGVLVGFCTVWQQVAVHVHAQLV